MGVHVEFDGYRCLVAHDAGNSFLDRPLEYTIERF